ncbi:class I SAM-dependent methyltransferase [Algoriphagus halophytocola]|uniref:Class I SAM-dependent methyltransferase n=1 Tax=Algoriphagus halophytocola TaxID=2991499 RepID=A0ABY6MG57_9BACT|nr:MULTISPECIES: class I SAM-dependent methyltransferase [unclassified Algoriphagus]UZD22429.1 class I SAM-dependent methyltransferase [Algoriphagus sp. TR-M5]WBL43689.1 class I SAM-dependent methyltransferase [Algoriphagus sp. TR-M9]
MLNRVHPLLAYVEYWLKQEDLYSLQSPFLFELQQKLAGFLLEQKNENLQIEEYREQLLQSHHSVPVQDFGAGSKKVNTELRQISKVAKYSTSSRKFAQLYQFFCQQTPANTVLELGTCLGITSRYLANATSGRVVSFEGAPELAQIARPHSGYTNLDIITGDLKSTLPNFLQTLENFDFALIDATHTYEGTLSYFEQLLQKIHKNSIIVIGDIHWSREMEKAWRAIIRKPEVQLSLDFFECGVLYFDFPGGKTDLILQF